MSEIERAIDDFKNYVEMGYGQYFRPSSESTEIALTALKEKLEREKNDPLTLKEMSEMNGMPIFVKEYKEWAICSIEDRGRHCYLRGTWFTTDAKKHELTCYRYEPKGEPNV